EYRFPFEEATFDLVLLLSVLTHVGREVELRLLRESCRVLSPNGRIVLTQYLLDAATRPLTEAGVTNPRFPYGLGEDRTQTPDTPEGFVARDEAWAKSIWELVGLTPISIRPGSWAGPTRPADEATVRYGFFQDLVILGRRTDGRS
ncbi:MAG TPA: methyltransferase domain-containing protein, partial [Thermoplasmata archaeon]|nr:methyltransferase domain-containing protein [Thermoplasmata archaeon]